MRFGGEGVHLVDVAIQGHFEKGGHEFLLEGGDVRANSNQRLDREPRDVNKLLP